MEDLIQSMNNFEQRNNMSIAVTLFSDNSATVEEFWDNEVLYEGSADFALEEFLFKTQYKLGPDGRSFSPVQKIN